jgi:hypothetical protein
MLSAALPWNVLSSRVGVGVLTEGWRLDAVGTEADDVRTFRTAVVFATPFSSIPVVQLGLTGFEAVISTWAGTRVFAVEVNWLAIGA